MSTAIAIIGASGGIGQALVRKLQTQQCELLFIGRDQESLQALREETGQGTVAVAVADARDRQALHDAIAPFAKDHDGLDGLVNLAGSIHLGSAARTSPELFAEIISINLTTAFNTIAVAQELIKQGSVVLMSSVAARCGLANHEAIAAAKAGVEGLTLAAAASGARKGLRVNAVAPGLVDTPLAKQLTSNENMRKASEKMHPIGRLGQPADIAQVIAMLLDPASSWLTGQVISVDGGLSTLRGSA